MPFDLDRLGAARDLVGIVLAQRHRADVQAGARAQAERGERVVVGQCERRRRDGVVEQQEEAVAVVDLAAAVAGEEGARAAVMLGEHARRARVAQALDDGRAVDEVGEEKRVPVHAIASSASGSRRQYVPMPSAARAHAAIDACLVASGGDAT